MTFKRCRTCNEEKLLSEFRRDKSQPSGYEGRCKVCARASIKGLYNRNYKEKYGQKGAVRRKENSDWLNNLKSELCCGNCGENDPSCIDFHHKDPSTKSFLVSHACSQRSLISLQKEIIKCVALCANCHRKHHAGKLNVDHLDLISI